jgi:hypothetical protein
VTTAERTGQRLWRLRKRHQWVDAELLAREASEEVVLRLYFNGTLAHDRRCETRTAAIAEAAARRRELEREGWIPQW